MLLTSFFNIPTQAGENKSLLSPNQIMKMEKENKTINPKFSPLETTCREVEILCWDPLCCMKNKSPRERLLNYVMHQSLTYNGQNVYDMGNFANGQKIEDQYLKKQRENIENCLDENGKYGHFLYIPAVLSTFSCLALFPFSGHISLPVLTTSLCCTCLSCAACCANDSELLHSKDKLDKK